MHIHQRHIDWSNKNFVLFGMNITKSGLSGMIMGKERGVLGWPVGEEWVVYNLIIEMFHQEDGQGGGLQVHLNLQEQPEWLDNPSGKLRKKRSQKALPPIVPPADPLLEQLQAQLQASRRGLPRGTVNQIKARAEQLEYGVFVGQTTSNKEEYFGALIEHNSPNPYVQQEISETVQQTHRQLQKEIHRNNIDMSDRVIPRNKGHLKQLEHQDHYRLIQLKQGEIKSKLGSLRQEMHKETLKDKLRNKIETLEQEHLDKGFYSIDHPRTKEAQNFVRDLQARRKDEQRELQYQMTLKQEADVRRRQQDAVQKEAERQQRKTKLQEYYQNRLVQRLEEKERERLKRQEYQEWVKSFQREKPLQLEKEEEFRMKVVIPQLEEQHKKLMTIKAEHRPIDPEEINDHEEKYLQFKKDNAIRKRAEIELRQEEQQQELEEINEKMYKGKYRYLVLEQMIEEKYPLNPKDIEQSKKDRIRAYNEHLRSFHQDRYTQKQQRIEAETLSNQKFVKRVRNMNGSMNITNRQQDAQQLNSDRPERKSAEDADHYKQGIQNLAYLKSMVREQQARDVAPPKINIIEEKDIKVKGYLEEQRQRRESNKKKEAAVSKEIQETAATANEEIDALKAKAEMLDQRLKRKEVRLKNVEQAKMGEGQRVEEDYVNAIKAKIHMLNQFD